MSFFEMKYNLFAMKEVVPDDIIKSKLGVNFYGGVL